MKTAREPGSVEAILFALGDPKRKQIVDMLADEDLSAGALAQHLEVSPQVISRHLRVLRKEGVIAQVADHGEEDARVRVYQLRRAPFQQLREWLSDVEDLWVHQLSRYHEHVEERAKPKRARS